MSIKLLKFVKFSALKKPTNKERISKDQQTTLLVVGATTVVIGASIVMITNLNKYIAFNGEVITEKDLAKKNYSISIEKSGACTKAKSGDGIYSDSELKNCVPNNIDYKDVPGTLRSTILSDMTSNVGLESIARTSVGICINQDTGKHYTHNELEELYEQAEGSNERRERLNAIKNCSALRVIPDALPSNANAEALLSSLNQIYLLSDWVPESLAPISGSGAISETGLASVPVSLRMNSNADQVMTFLANLNKSIRYFSITSFNIEFKNDIEMNATAEAYYVNDANTTEKTVVLKLNNGKGK